MIFDVTKRPIFKDHNPNAWYLRPSRTDNANVQIGAFLVACAIAYAILTAHIYLS